MQRVLVTIRLSQGALDEYDRLGGVYGLSRSEVIRQALRMAHDGLEERLRKLKGRASDEERMP